MPKSVTNPFHMELDIKKWLILAFFICLPFEKRHVFYFINDLNVVAIYLSDIIVGLMILELIRSSFGKDSHETYLSKSEKSLFLAIFLFLAIAILHTTFLSHGTIAKFGLYSIVKLIELLIVFICFSQLELKKYKTWILASITASALIQSLITIGQFLKQGSLGLGILGENVLSVGIAGIAKIDTASGKLIRAYGTFAHPNQLAAFLAVACATMFILFLAKKAGDSAEKSLPFKKLIPFVLGLFLISVGELISFSRAGILAFILNLLITGFAIYKYRRTDVFDAKKKIWILAAILIMAFAAVGPLLNSRLTVTDQSSVNRLNYDKIGLEIIKNTPWLGVGLGNIIPAVSRTGQFTQNWQLQPPHNYFILVACETGLIGLALTLYIFGKLLILQLKRFKFSMSDIFLTSSLIIILFLMQFDHYFYTQQQMQLLLWALLGIICGNVYRGTAENE